MSLCVIRFSSDEDHLAREREYQEQAARERRKQEEADRKAAAGLSVLQLLTIPYTSYTD